VVVMSLRLRVGDWRIIENVLVGLLSIFSDIPPQEIADTNYCTIMGPA
jgi:hypothetical protein